MTTLCEQPKCPDVIQWWFDADDRKSKALIDDFVNDVCWDQNTEFSRKFHKELQRYFEWRWEKAGGVL